jgi:hypothetical protein
MQAKQLTAIEPEVDVPHGTNIRDLHYTESVAKYSALGIAARYPIHFSRLLCNA